MKPVQLISRNLKQINNLYTKSLSKELSAIQLDDHFEVLFLLSIQEQPVTQNKLAQLLQIDKSRMANIVFYLEKKELITVETNPADRRQHYVYLSSTALPSIPYIEKTIKKINQLAETGIAEEKLNVFFEVSEMIRQNLVNNTAVKTAY
jgi:DNA-binding MarR family transcriptional regulator